jgi:hypothetical protein
VAHHDVGNLVAHHTGEFSFAGRLNGSDVHVDGAARERESIDFFLSYNAKRIGELEARGFGRELLAESVDVLRSGMVGREERQFFLDLGDRLAAELDLLVDGVAARLRVVGDAAFLGVDVGEGGREGDDEESGEATAIHGRERCGDILYGIGRRRRGGDASGGLWYD